MSELNLTFLVRNYPEQVFSYLSDMERFASIHPVISRVQVQAEGYLLHETLRFVGIPISFSYPATVTAEPETRRVVMKATVSRLVHIEIRFGIFAEEGGTRIDEAVTFRSWLPVHPFLKYTFKKQHTRLFENLNKIAVA